MENYPIASEKVQKGQFIAPEDLPMRPCAPGSDTYRLELLRMRDLIDNMMHMERRPVSIVCRGTRLYVLTDAEAAAYHRARSDQAVKSLGKQAQELRTKVDRSALLERQADEYDRNISLCALRYQSVLGAPRALARAVPQTNSDIPRTLGHG
jgi:hypothetical protein